jgi:asparagine synthase (glutamine-hydrolysing)
MCGIAGFFGLRDNDAHRTVSSMCERIRHRGPDGGGATVHEGVALGMVRLAVVDVEHGKQPMFSDDGAIAMVYNGEIYNAPALRRELEAEGVRFRTRSDTEVILRLYERDPVDVENRLRGMWAFAIHDRGRRRLTLSRDRFGIKPLFVADVGAALAFGSELRAFTPIRDMPQLASSFRIDSGAAHAMLAWSYVPNNDTIYTGVRRLPPATRLEIDLATGRRTSTKYYRPTPSVEASRVRSLDDACAFVAPLLRDAVMEHLESDVPVAAFLSGGIDSSLVLANALERSSHPVAAFSIGFREPRFDESPYAREVAQRLGAKLHVEVFDEAMAQASLADALAAYDEPFGDSSSLATFLLSRVVGRTHKVALGGDGGDEVFAGYKKHQIIRIRDALSHVPKLGELAGRALGALPSRTDRSSAYAESLRTARRLARGLRGTDDAAYLALTQVAALDRVAPLVERPAEPERFVEPILRLFQETSGSQLRRTLVSDLANVLPNDMLTKVDRASMACHLEARVPLLDHRVVEAGLGLPARFTLFPDGKRVLRELYARRFGQRLARRKKTGFGVPVEKWLRGSLERQCGDAIDDHLARFDVLSARTLGDGRWRELRRTDPQILWHVFAFAAWSNSQKTGD